MKNFYPQSKAIFQKIKNSERILINIHRYPDLDSVGSALALAIGLEKLNKKITVISPQKLSEKFLFLPRAKKIKIINFSSFDFSAFDLFLILDSSSDEMATGKKEIRLSPTPFRIVIDHHKTNAVRAEIKLVDEKASAVGEIIYSLFQDWGLEIDKKTATCLFASIYSDTVSLRYPRDPKRTFAIINDLVKKGADQKALIEKFYQQYSFNDLKLLGYLLARLEIEKKYQFAWTGIDYDNYQKFKQALEAKEILTDNFLQSIKEAEIGAVILEDKKGVCRVSFRSKGKIDVSQIAQRLGGGGHKNAAGATIEGSFSEAKNKIMLVLKKFIKA